MATLKPKAFRQALLDKINKNDFESAKEIIETHSEQHYFHEVLSEVYEEVGSIKRVQLSDQLQQLIEERLIKVRLFEKDEKHEENTLAESTDRIELLVFLIGELNIHRQSSDGAFVFICRTIAANVHVLRKTLDFTCVLLPCEELEFCLVMFIAGVMNRDLTTISELLLDREKIFCYLNQFHSALCIEKSKLHSKKVADRVGLKDNIVSNYPRFRTLYEDYEVLRDVYMLEQMRGCLSTLLSLDDESPIRQLAAERTLQVIVENLKSTTEAEKQLLNAAPKQLRNILTRLKNKSSYSGILVEKIFIEKYNCESIINYLREFFFETFTILYKHLEKACERFNVEVNNDENTIKSFTGLSQKIENVKTELAMHQSVNKPKENKVLKQHFAARMAAINSRELTVENTALATNAKLKKEKVELEDFSEEKIVFSVCLKVEDSLEDEEDKQCFYNQLKAHKALHFAKVGILCGKVTSNEEYQKIIKAFPMAETLSKLSMEEDLEEIKEIIKGVSDAYGLLIEDVAANGVIGLKNYKSFLNKFCRLMDLENDDIFEHLMDYFKEKLEAYFEEKIKQLADADNFNLKPQTLSTEILLLDLLEILMNTYNFTDNASYLDRPAPLLIGKNLRDYLAHGNPLIETFPFAPTNSMEIHSTFFKELTLTFNEDVNYGQTANFSLKHAREYHQKYLAIVENQAAMFEAARKGDLAKVKECVCRRNANPLALDVNGESALKCAVKADNVELLAFLFKQNVKESVNDLLEVAAESGSESALVYLLEGNDEAKEYVQGVDSKLLHLAVLNDKEGMVKLLLSLGNYQF